MGTTALVAITGLADFIEGIGQTPLPIPYLRPATLLAADVMRLFVELASLGHAAPELLIRRALDDAPAIAEARAAREKALQDALSKA